ncbi:hypothetical protein Pmani_019815 [Petrolisthes manimaculis]|uniref:Uncharacterized protein n=1 Tax=Petrolisthes manimaculis TaxID=1843537 RepID=A0AAE1PJN4_9EUCA|nr:hypothetical protein Pmani_019815 [Petrolisthes manimaculis]
MEDNMASMSLKMKVTAALRRELLPLYISTCTFTPSVTRIITWPHYRLYIPGMIFEGCFRPQVITCLKNINDEDSVTPQPANRPIRMGNTNDVQYFHHRDMGGIPASHHNMWAQHQIFNSKRCPS